VITAAELALLRASLPNGHLPNGNPIPGLDTTVGNRQASLTSPTTLPTNPGGPLWYDAAHKRVVVRWDNITLSGYNFSGLSVEVDGSDCTIQNCTFDDNTPYQCAVVQEVGASGLTVTNCTFNGGDNVEQECSVNGVSGHTTISGCLFLNTPDHAVDLAWGSVTNCAFMGSKTGSHITAHVDAISLLGTTGPVTISGNYIDWTNNPGEQVTNNAIRVTSEGGNNTDGVTVTGNIILGGQNTFMANQTPIAGTTTQGLMNNVVVSGNWIGFGVASDFATEGAIGANSTGVGTFRGLNTIFDWTNQLYSTNAWAAYVANGVGTTHLITSSGGAISGAASGSTTLYGGGFNVGMHGSANETVFVGGAGGQIMVGGAGANIFKYLAISDSPANGAVDVVMNFDPDKDVIDLSPIDANLSVAGVQSFTFIGTAPFSGSGGQVRYQLDPTNNQTLVEADLAGDSAPDLEIRLSGLVNLSAADFALTSAQSSADMAAGAALQVAETARYGVAAVKTYTNVIGKSYSSFQAFYPSGVVNVADDLNLSSTANELDLWGSNLTISRAAGTECLQAGATKFPAVYHANETIQVGTAGSETFALSSGFGNETIAGFSPSGAGSDSLRLQTSMFSYLNSSMSQSADLAAVIGSPSHGVSGITIADSYGDRLNLPGVTSSMLLANPGNISFV
jgi:hypothetical protein